MNKEKKVVYLFFFLIGLVVLFVGYLSIGYVFQEFLLKREVNALTKLDISKDNFNRKLVTTGNYRIVEKTIKNYLNEYSNNIKNTNHLITDSEFTNLLSYDNLSSDTDYEKSTAYVEDLKGKFNLYIDDMIGMCSVESIKKPILDANVETYYITLYEKLMLDDSISSKLRFNVEYLESYKKSMNTKFDACLELFHYLKENKDNVEYSDGEIKLKTQEMINQYNEYINKIK
ncbi:MAG: hypothetical protein IJ193_09035 [Bacilli bacterium]|nr:hypothetical protein [Bacilli bacterium]